MKHLLIIISILLLSSPVIGQETNVLYQYKSSSGLVWKTFGNEKLQPKYEGQVENGIPNGQGIFTSSDGSKYSLTILFSIYPIPKIFSSIIESVSSLTVWFPIFNLSFIFGLGVFIPKSFPYLI